MNGENYMIKIFMTCTFPKNFRVEKSKRDRMGTACGKQGRAYKCTRHLVVEPERKGRLKKFRHRWDENTNSGPRIGPSKGSCEYGTEHLGSTTGVELLDELSDHQLLKRTPGHAVCGDTIPVCNSC
jgi:hypothetical protein